MSAKDEIGDLNPFTLRSPMSPLRVAPSGRVFQTFDGEAFLPVGANDSIMWAGLKPLRDRLDVPSVQAYLKSFADNGANIVRLFLEYAHDDKWYFEKPVGSVQPKMAQLWDDLFDECERAGLRVLLAPWDNFWMARRWHRHPYNACNGGPAGSCSAFFEDEATIEATMRRFEWVIERYAGRAVLAAWDLFNEIDPYWGADARGQSAVLARLSQAIRAKELAVQGWTRPQSVSCFGPNPQGDLADLIFRHPDFDFATTHIYSPGAIDFPRDTFSPAVQMAQWTRFGRSQTPASRPFFDTEHGPIHLFNDRKRWLEEEFDVEYERHLMWAHLASGGAGSGFRWPARHPHVLLDGHKTAFKGLALFARALDWNTFEHRDATAELEVRGGARQVVPFALRDENQGLVYFLRRPSAKHRGIMPHRAPLSSVEVRWPNWSAARVRVRYFEPIAGCWLDEETVAPRKGVLKLQLPAWDRELAVALGTWEVG